MDTMSALDYCPRWGEYCSRCTARLDCKIPEHAHPPAADELASGVVPYAMTLGWILAKHPDAETGILVARGVNGEERRRCPVAYVPSMRLAALVRKDCLMWYPATSMADALGLPGARPLPGLVELGALLPE